MYIGCHVSAAGKNGILKAINQIELLGGNALQIFVSNRVGKGTKQVSEEEAIKIKEKLKKNILLFIHSPYTLNFSAQFNSESWMISLIIKELEIAHQIGAKGCIIHMGKSLKNDVEYSIINFIKSIKYIVSKLIKENMQTKIILETPAGQGTELFVKFEDFAKMFNSFTKDEKKYIGLCIDTCHIFAAGYKVKDYFKLFKKEIGLNFLSIIHFNDSKKDLGSCVDRHENIGYGKIKPDDLNYSLKIGAKNKIPIILETPDITRHSNEIIYLNTILSTAK